MASALGVVINGASPAAAPQGQVNGLAGKPATSWPGSGSRPEAQKIDGRVGPRLSSRGLTGRPRIPEALVNNREAAAYGIPAGACHRARRRRDPAAGMTVQSQV